MHRSGLARREAVPLAIELGHHAIEIAALGEIDRVAAIGGVENVARAEIVANADCHRFLTDREMHRTLDLVRGVDADDLFLDAANPVELAIEPFDLAEVLGHTAGGPLGTGCCKPAIGRCEAVRVKRIIAVSYTH